jgi:CheY-like chemotaxis protein
MTKKLLVADDSVTIQKVVKLTFAGEDVAIEAIASGEQALEKARSMRPDIVLADVSMPGRNGYELCAAIKSDPELSSTPVVLLVGTFEPFDESEAGKAGYDGHLTKPFDTSELIRIVHSLVEKRQSQPAAAAPAAPGRSGSSSLVSSRTRESFLGPGRILDVFGGAAAALLQPETPDPPPVPPPPAEVESPAAPAEATQNPPEPASPRPSLVPRQIIPFPATRAADAGADGIELPDELVNLVVDRVIRRMSPEVIREVAWEIIPELSEIIIRQILNEKGIPGKE